MSRQLYNFPLEIRRKTPKALLVSDGVIEEWLPRSRIACIGVPKLDKIKEGDIVTLQVEEWLAREKGLL